MHRRQSSQCPRLCPSPGSLCLEGPLHWLFPLLGIPFTQFLQDSFPHHLQAFYHFCEVVSALKMQIYPPHSLSPSLALISICCAIFKFKANSLLVTGCFPNHQFCILYLDKWIININYYAYFYHYLLFISPKWNKCPEDGAFCLFCSLFLRVYPLDQCFLNFNMPKHLLGISLKCRF